MNAASIPAIHCDTVDISLLVMSDALQIFLDDGKAASLAPRVRRAYLLLRRIPQRPEVRPRRLERCNGDPLSADSKNNVRVI